eukprot:scaffold558_cov376-Prasinococcus_capsulatus_cf.AAC.2
MRVLTHSPGRDAACKLRPLPHLRHEGSQKDSTETGTVLWYAVAYLELPGRCSRESRRGRAGHAYAQGAC